MSDKRDKYVISENFVKQILEDLNRLKDQTTYQQQRDLIFDRIQDKLRYQTA